MRHRHSIIQLYAGIRSDGECVYEKVAARLEGDDCYRALHSPGFVHGLARGDIFALTAERAGAFVVLERSGNLAVRVYSRVPAAVWDGALTPQVTQLEGLRDILADRLLVYTLPLAAGFETIESTFDQALSGSADALWRYGNVYHEISGEPLEWWLAASARR